MNFEFMTIDTPLPPCMPFPIALTGFPVSSTAKVMYCRMLDAMLEVYMQHANFLHSMEGRICFQTISNSRFLTKVRDL